MLKKILLVLSVTLLTFNGSSQNESLFKSNVITSELKENANSVIRLSSKRVHIKSPSKMVVNIKRIITVLNKQGNGDVDAFVNYDDGLQINDLQVLVFDANGKQIKKIKKKDFKDQSAVDGGTLYSDARVKFLDYTPIVYPYTIEFTYETETDNTAFIPWFYPLNTYYLSVEKSEYILENPKGLEIRYKEQNLDEFNIEKEETSDYVKYTANLLKAIKPEDHSPLLTEIMPKVMFALNTFTLEGVEGQVQNWNDFGKWMYSDLIDGNQDLPESTINEVKALVENETSTIDKAKKVYDYVQNKTRYISVQVGIGGWKPFSATEVDKLSYGDCKGLTNYTMALLDAVGVESNYTVVFSGKTKRNIEKDFASIQGNHVILSIPNGKDTTWLECTSQKLPFGFIGDFTDDRDVLVVTPDGGKIQRTKKYTTEDNLQIIKSVSKILEDGSIDVNLTRVSKGIQYDNKYWLDGETERNIDQYYKNQWDYINNMTFDNFDISNDKEAIELNEIIDFKATNYANVVGERMLVVLNTVNRNTYIPDRYRNRNLPLRIYRGYKDVDEIEIHIPETYRVEALPKAKLIENKFGSYKSEIKKIDDKTLVYRREFIIEDGQFSKEDYELFRDFYKEVAKQDNSKMAIIKQ